MELQCNDKVEPAKLKSFSRRGDRRVWDDSGQWTVFDWETLDITSLIIDILHWDEIWRRLTVGNILIILDPGTMPWCHGVMMLYQQTLSSLASSNTSWPFSAKFFQFGWPDLLPFLCYLPDWYLTVTPTDSDVVINIRPSEDLSSQHHGGIVLLIRVQFR